MVLACILYVFLAVGSISPYFLPIQLGPAFLALSVMLVMMLSRSSDYFQELAYSAVALTPILLVLLLSSLHSQNLEYAFYKVDGAVLVTLVTAPLAAYSARRLGELRFAVIFRNVALLVLFTTVAYKINFGFWDRGVRYFINGPIVFGWIMSAAAIISLYTLRREGGLFSALLCIIFSLAVLWTLSKGPILALCVSATYVLLDLKRPLKVFSGLAIMLIGVYLASGIFPDAYLVRLQGIQRIITGDLQGSDSASTYVRFLMILQSTETFVQNASIGVGLGDWSRHADFLSRYDYPHNIYLELLAETGLFGAAVIFTAIGRLFYRSSKLGRAIALVFLLGSAFSGDISYLRLPLTFLIAFRVRSSSPAAEDA